MIPFFLLPCLVIILEIGYKINIREILFKFKSITQYHKTWKYFQIPPIL